MNTNNVYNPDKVSAPARPTDKLGPTSLAAFMGSRASGPRLNRHAPQQDAHDPTQFVQPDTSRPHPIFGRGGIAMPGMADKKGSNAYGLNAGSESSERYRPSFTEKSKSPSPPTVNVSSKMETSNLNSADIFRRSLTGPYVAKIEQSPVHLDTEIPHFNFPSFRTTKSTSSIPFSPFTKKDNGQEEELYIRSSNSSNKLADRFLSDIPNLTSALPAVSVSTPQPRTSISTVAATPKSTLPKPLTTRTGSTERAQGTPLRKLMEINNIHNPDTAAAQANQKSEVSSLAAFIGGRATGPRLNRHAPQQDVHDSAQLVQPELSVPHPIFGKGGIAMPGMTTKQSSLADVESSYSRAPKSTMPLGQNKGENKGTQERTTSGSSSKEELESLISRPSPTFGARTTRDRTISTPSYSRTIGTSPELSRSSTPSRLSNSTLGLAQPIRPDIKAPSILHQSSSTYMPSPAFQRPLNQKDPTPSISRLQGRGFVQNMVKVSAELETSSPTPSPGKSRPASGRKNTVLDRWRPMQANTSPTRPASAQPDVMRRSTTFNSTNMTSDNFDVSAHATGNSRPLKSVASLPSLMKAATPKEIDFKSTRVDKSLIQDRPPGLGSSSTLVVIKPSKSSGDLDQVPWLDELGMKYDPTNSSRQHKGPHFSPRSEKATSSRKPTTHVR